MFRSPLLAAVLVIAGSVSCAGEALTPMQDPVVRGRVEGAPGVRVKSVSDAAANVEISFGMGKFTAASAQLDFAEPASPRTPSRFYFANTAATVAARVLVDVSRGAPSAAEPAISAEPSPDLAALCRIDPHARETMAEALEASF